MVICRMRGENDLRMVKLMQLTPYHLLLHYYAKWFTFLVPAYPGCPGNHTTPQPFYGPFSGTTQVSRCQKRTSGLYGTRED